MLQIMPAYFIFFVGINIDKFILIKLLQAENYSCFSNREQAEELRLFFQRDSSIWIVQLEMLNAVLRLFLCTKVKLY